MSLLFDALKRAQQSPGIETKDNHQQDINSAQAVLASGHHFRPLSYLVATLMLLTGSALWYYYQQSQTSPIALPPVQVAEAASAVPVTSPAASSVAEVVAKLPATASGADNLAYQDKSWTHPVEHKKTTPHRRKAAPLKLQASERQDPLKSAYRALSAGNLNQAEQGYQSVLAQHPHEKDALLGLAVIAQRKQQNERATELYRQVLREDLGNAAAAAGLVSLSVHADPVAAESQVRELIDLKPNAPEFHYALGGVLARQLRWGEAQQAYFRAYSLEPGRSLYAYNLAVTLDRLHQSAAALSYYEKAAQLDNDPMLNQATIQQRIQELSVKN